MDPTKQQLKTFPGLDPKDLRHPDDIKATKRLTAVPGFELIYKKVVEYGFERAYYLANTAANVRVGNGMFPRLLRYAEWAARVLDMEVPELYVSLNPARPRRPTVSRGPSSSSTPDFSTCSTSASDSF